MLAVPPRNVEALRAICESHNVEMCDLGQFGTPNGDLVLNYRGTEVGRMSMEFLHDGLPEVVREAEWTPPASRDVLAPDIAGSSACRSARGRAGSLLVALVSSLPRWVLHDPSSPLRNT